MNGSDGSAGSGSSAANWAEIAYRGSLYHREGQHRKQDVGNSWREKMQIFAFRTSEGNRSEALWVRSDGERNAHRPGTFRFVQ